MSGKHEYEPEDATDNPALDRVWNAIGKERQALPPVSALSETAARAKLREYEAGELPQASKTWIAALKRRLGE